MSTETLDLSSTPAIPFTRLVQVELRKMYDTRAGRWLLISIAGLTGLVLVIQLIVLLVKDQSATLGSFGAGANIPMVILLPVLGVMSVTGEWSQRTAMVTFALVPSRGRVIAAKYVSALAIALIAVVVAYVLMIVANLLYGAFSSHPMVWDFGGAFGIFLVFLLYVISLSIGFAFGAAILNTAGAIVVYFVYDFVLPGLMELGAHLLSWFHSIRPWIDFSNAQTPLQGGSSVTGQQWAHLLVSGSIWLGIPLAIGIRRMLRAEVK
ncbi:ABC transporter permease subunit [Leekyejoonella antrihumi]|nr:ABC transporter permease subunit [Leekyejoonella antrihumi]